MLLMVPSRSEFRARIRRVAFAFAYAFSGDFGGVLGFMWGIEGSVNSSVGGLALVGCVDPELNLEARLEKEVARPYSSCVNVSIECKAICRCEG